MWYNNNNKKLTKNCEKVFNVLQNAQRPLRSAVSCHQGLKLIQITPNRKKRKINKYCSDVIK